MQVQLNWTKFRDWPSAASAGGHIECESKDIEQIVPGALDNPAVWQEFLNKRRALRINGDCYWISFAQASRELSENNGAPRVILREVYTISLEPVSERPFAIEVVDADDIIATGVAKSA